MIDLRSRLAAEALDTALLLAIIIGSGIMAERLAGGNVAVALLANTAVAVGGLYILIEVLGPISGAHFNPTVRTAMATRAELSGLAPAPHIAAQLMGAVLGTWLTHVIFDMTIPQLSTKVRSRSGQWIAEAVATVGLLLVILRAPNGHASSMVAAYIGTAYWFTAPTSFANPAAAFGCMFSNSFADIAPSNVPGFVLAECAGAVLGLMLHRMLEPRLARRGHPNVIESSGEHSAD